MTSTAQAALYETMHLAEYRDKPLHVYNPNDKPVEELPTIIGFNNGGQMGWFEAVLIAEDGTILGGHVCSSEAYMPHDLGVLEGSREDRHEEFKKHYPDGYRMEFVSHAQAKEGHQGLKDAFAKYVLLKTPTENAQ